MSPRRRELFRRGRHGDTIRVKIDTRVDRAVVYYRGPDGKPRTAKFPNTKEGRAEAVAFAEGWYEERQHVRPEKTTLRSLWQAYRTSRFPLLRAATRVNYAQRWDKWELYLGAEHDPNDTTLADIERYIGETLKAGRAVNQVRQILNVARVVYAWGQRMRMVRSNEFALYRWQKPRDAEVLEPEEYTAAEFRALLAELSPQRHDDWRIWSCVMLAGHHGQRANAVLHLREDDIVGDEIVWPARYQKAGEIVRQPLSDEALSVLLTSRWWKARLRIDSPWVIPGWKRKAKAPYGYQAMWLSLKRLERKAGVRHKPQRGLHSLRRMVVGDVIEATGDRMLGLEYVGDKDPKVLRSYDKRVAERVKRAAEALSRVRQEERSATETVPEVCLPGSGHTPPVSNPVSSNNIED